ncbi:MAG TPA: class E sortase [Mycobacteriales bacterium]|nr:class E sortase [Mycobacteriales bacterium]
MSDAVRTVLRGLGQTLITAGVVVLLFCVYELKFTSAYTAQEQKKLDKALVKEWDAAPTGPVGPVVPASASGTGFARVYLPTLGRKEVHVVVEGVGHDDLKKGPGHFPGTALPGQVGNLVISGHRTTYGAPFNRLDELDPGDAIVVETRTQFFTYTVQRLFVVKPSAIGVTYPVPDRRGVVPTQRLLTLTTCNPKYSAKTRLIVRAVLSATLDKGPGVVPPALQAVA